MLPGIIKYAMHRPRRAYYAIKERIRSYKNPRLAIGFQLLCIYSIVLPITLVAGMWYGLPGMAVGLIGLLHGIFLAVQVALRHDLVSVPEGILIHAKIDGRLLKIDRDIHVPGVGWSGSTIDLVEHPYIFYVDPKGIPRTITQLRTFCTGLMMRCAYVVIPYHAIPCAHPKCSTPHSLTVCVDKYERLVACKAEYVVFRHSELKFETTDGCTVITPPALERVGLKCILSHTTALK